PPPARPEPGKPSGPGVPAAPPRAGGPAAAPEKPKKPIDLSARSVEAFVLRFGSRNEMDRLRCEGTVRVLQEPATPDEKGVDIRGQTLQLNRFPKGNVLVVTADQASRPRELAYVQMDKITMIGPEVNIDQVANKAWVNGIGSMKMPSTTDFEGK